MLIGLWIMLICLCIMLEDNVEWALDNDHCAMNNVDCSMDNVEWALDNDHCAMKNMNSIMIEICYGKC